MSSNVLDFTEMQLDKLTTDTIMYAIEPIAGGLNGDRRIKFGTIMNKIIGTDMGTVQELKSDLVLSVRSSNGSFNKLFTFSAIDEYLFGKTDFTDVVKDIKIRATKGSVRGFVSLENISKFLIEGDKEVVSLTDLGNTSVRLVIGNKNSKVDYSIFRSSLFGNQVYEELEQTDNIMITRGNSSAGKIAFSKFAENIVSNVTIGSERVKETLSIYSKDVIGGGWTTLTDIATFVLSGIDIPEFTLGVDKFNPVDDHILFKSTALAGKFGIIKGSDLRSTIFNDHVIQAIEVKDSVFYCNNGTMTFEILSKSIMDLADEKYIINPANMEDNINDGDGILFYSTGSSEGSNADRIKNTSFVTVRDKILGSSNITLNDNTVIYCRNGNERGTVTYAQLKSKLISDIATGG